MLEAILAFSRCRSSKDFKHTFRSHLFQLLEASSGLYAWTDPDISNVQIVGAVNIPEQTVRVFQDYIPYDGLAKDMISKGRGVMAYDVDIDVERYSETVDRFFGENPQYNRLEHPYFDAHKTAVVALELPEPTMGFALHRTGALQRQMTRRDVRVLELIRPHILESMKTVLLSEELSKYRTLSEALMETLTPTVLLTADFRIVVCNVPFQKAFEIGTNKKLPERLVTVLQNETSKYEPRSTFRDVDPSIPFHQIGAKVFRLTLSRLENEILDEPNLWLLRLKPATDVYSQINKQMQEAGLTAREMEIASLIRTGIGPKDIAARLFVSFDTVKTHLHHIHQKLGVHTRGQLIALLNPPLNQPPDSI